MTRFATVRGLPVGAHDPTCASTDTRGPATVSVGVGGGCETLHEEALTAGTETGPTFRVPQTTGASGRLGTNSRRANVPDSAYQRRAAAPTPTASSFIKVATPEVGLGNVPEHGARTASHVGGPARGPCS